MVQIFVMVPGGRKPLHSDDHLRLIYCAFVSKAVEWIVMKSLRVNCRNFGDPSDFSFSTSINTLQRFRPDRGEGMTLDSYTLI